MTTPSRPLTLVADRPDQPWRQDWPARAACADRLDLPWTTDAADLTAWQMATMRAVCDGCPVVLDCLAAVDALDVTGGWWAGHDRDPDTTGYPLAPDWATDNTSDPAADAVPVAWVPIRSGRGGPVLGEQLALRLA